jgi:uncharacterized protein with PQ loop repeat
MLLSSDAPIVLLGFAGASVSCMISLPQAIKALREPVECLLGVSRLTWGIITLNAAIWLLWAILVGQICAGLPSMVNGPAALVILWRTRRSASAGSGPSGAGLAPGRPDRPGLAPAVIGKESGRQAVESEEAL